MAKRDLNRRQTWRIEKIQEERAARAQKREQRIEFSGNDLGPEQHGLVIAHYGTQIEVEATDGENIGKIIRCHMRANLGSLVTGDKVVWRDGSPTGVIEAVLPRHSALTRPDPHGSMKVVAANIDRIAIVIAPYPHPHANLIDRYLVAAESLDIEPIILLNKTDLIDDSNRQRLAEWRQRYSGLGYTWLEISTTRSEGIAELTGYLANYTSVFVGQSGVGKSSLINALLPEANLRVGALSEATQKGTHTTTTAQLFHFPSGGDLIDSPGIREFGLWHMEPEAVLEGFIEFRPFIGHCKFRDCAHVHEPGCAIKGALETGKVSAERMHSYRQILASLDEQ